MDTVVTLFGLNIYRKKLTDKIDSHIKKKTGSLSYILNWLSGCVFPVLFCDLGLFSCSKPAYLFPRFFIP